VNWEVHVINSSIANAVVLPGGKIFVYMGLVRLAEEKDQIAGVLAHEIGHQIAKHSSERLSWVKVLTAAQFVLSIFTDPSLFFNKLFLDVGFLVVFVSYVPVEFELIVPSIRIHASVSLRPTISD
jgi:Zn-dependent protease with chaperone function